MTEKKLTGTDFLIKQLEGDELAIIMSAINVYGDGDHPVADGNTITYFALSYISHCLGRQHHAVIGAGLMKNPEEQDEKHLMLHEAHQSIIDKIEDAIELGR